MLVDKLQKYLKKTEEGGRRENVFQRSHEICFTLQILMPIKK